MIQVGWPTTLPVFIKGLDLGLRSWRSTSNSAVCVWVSSYQECYSLWSVFVLWWTWLLCHYRTVKRFLITFPYDLIKSLCVLLVSPSSLKKKTEELETATLCIDCCFFIYKSSPVGVDCCHLMLDEGITSLCLCKHWTTLTYMWLVNLVEEWIST